MLARPVIRPALRGLFGPPFRDRDALERFQGAGLRALVRHAHDHVPFYRKRFEAAGIQPHDVRGIGDLGKIPVTERADLQLLPAEEVCARGLAPHVNRVLQTSGSSGAPLTVRRTLSEERLLLAYRAKAVGAWGFGLRSRRVNIDHFSPEALRSETRPMAYERLGVMPRLNLDWRMSKRDIVSRIAAFRPDLISGPPSLLAELAVELGDADRSRIAAARVLTGAERLSATDRDRIEGGFGCPVTDIYGCTEIVFIGMEAPGHDGYRLCEEAVIVEVLQEGLPSPRGEIYLTGLHQWSMPFIRYRLGDLVEVAQGPGPHRLLHSIDGRVTDRFTLPDGRRIHGYTLGEVVEKSGLPVRRFQIVQERRDAFRIRLVLAGPTDPELRGLEGDLRDALGADVDVNVEVTERLHRSRMKADTFVSVERLRVDS